MLVQWLKDITLKDTPKVGNRAAWLAEAHRLQSKDVPVPNGFVITGGAYQEFLKHNKLDKKIKLLVEAQGDYKRLARVCASLRQEIARATLPPLVQKEMVAAFAKFAGEVDLVTSTVAPEVSEIVFVDQEKEIYSLKNQGTFLQAYKDSLTALYSVEAVRYAQQQGIDHRTVARAAIVLPTVIGLTGTIATFDTRTGSRNLCVIEIAGKEPGVLKVFKGIKPAVIARARENRLTDSEAEILTKEAVRLEKELGLSVKLSWVKSSAGDLVFVGLTPLSAPRVDLEYFHLTKEGKVIMSGEGFGEAVIQGAVASLSTGVAASIIVLNSARGLKREVVEKNRAIVLEQEASSVVMRWCQELGVPLVHGIKKATKLLKDGQIVTLHCHEGKGELYNGRLPFWAEKIVAEDGVKTKTKLFVTVTTPDKSAHTQILPADGAGLIPLEMVYTDKLGVHPLAYVEYSKIKDKKIKERVKEQTRGYVSPEAFALGQVAEQVALVAAAFYPREVMVRLPDAKNSDYRELIGGELFEEKNDDGILGWHGAARFYDERFTAVFKMECAAIKKVREEWGLKNVSLVVPFCRTVDEGKRVLSTMENYGLTRGKHGLKIYVTCEIPSNALLATDFATIFDGFAVRLGTLTQLTLGVDKSSLLTSFLYNEEDAAVKKLLTDVIAAAQRLGKSVFVADQSLRDNPALTAFLVQAGVNGLVFTPDMFTRGRAQVVSMEAKFGNAPKSVAAQTLLKTASFAGVAGLSLLLTGYTCQTVNNQDVEKRIREQVAEQVLAAKHEIREKLRIEQAEKDGKEKRLYNENSFAKFNLKYPAGWNVSHEQNGVEFAAAKHDDGYFAVRYLVNDHVFEKQEDVSTTTWNGWEGLKQNKGNIMVARFYPFGVRLSRHVIEFTGEAAVFDEIMHSVADFDLPKK